MVLWIQADDRDECEFDLDSDDEESDDEEGNNDTKEPTGCETTRSELEQQLKIDTTNRLFCADPLQELMQLRKKLKDSCAGNKICRPCFQAVDRNLCTKMQSIWDSLPEVFNLQRGRALSSICVQWVLADVHL